MWALYWGMYAVSGVLPNPFGFNGRCKKLSSHLSHRRAYDLFTRLFRQGVAKVKEEARYEYLKDIGLDLARPWPKGILGMGVRCLELAESISSLFPAFRIMPLPMNWISIKNISRQLEVYNLDALWLTS